jgi:hypothetical protein
VAISIKSFLPAKFAENSQTSQYAPVSARAIIDKFTATNSGSAVVVFSVNIVPNGGVASASNRILSLRSIMPGETYNCPELVGHVLDNGAAISTLCDTASALIICISGREVV